MFRVINKTITATCEIIHKPLNRYVHIMVKYTQTIRRVSDHFVELGLKVNKKEI